MNINWLLGPAIVLGVWGVATVVLVGLGLGAGRLARLRSGSLLDAFWFGYCLTIVFLQVWHFWFPVSTGAAVCIAGVGLVGFLVAIGDVTSALARLLRQPLTLILLGAMILWVANRATGPVENNDSAAYHITAVRWNTDYPIVPGLGNLQGRLAFNNSSLLFVALFEVGWLRGSSSHFANSLLVAALFWQIIVGSRGLLARDRSPTDRAVAAYHALLFVPAVAIVVSKELAAPATDLPPSIILLYSASRLFEILLRRRERAEHQIDALAQSEGFTMMTTAVTLGIAVCLKLSAIVFAPFAWLAIVGTWLLSPGTIRRWVKRRMLIAATTLSCVAIGVWLFRGVMLSGYPLFPSEIASANVDWRMPAERVKFESQIIKEWARYGRAEFIQSSLAKVPWLNRLVTPRAEIAAAATPIVAPDGSDSSELLPPDRKDPWVALWIIAAVVSTPTEIAVPIAVALIAWCAALVRRKRSSAGFGASFAVGALAVLGVVSWFMIAPEPRFGASLFWTLAAAGVAALMLTIKGPHDAVRLGRLLVVSCMLMAMIPIAHRMLRIRMQTGQSPLRVMPFYYPGPQRGLHPLPTAQVGEYQTHWGTVVIYPVQSTEMFDAHAIFDGPLPCSSQVSKFLRMRKEGDLSQGFRIDVPASHRRGG